LHTRHNSKIPSRRLPLNQNLWQHMKLEKCSFMCAASSGTSTYPRKLPVGYTKTMMPAPLWQMHRSLQVAPAIWTFDITSYANGLNAILLSSNGSTPPSMKRITSRNPSLRSFSIGTLTTSWVTCHQNNLRHTNNPRANSTSPLLILFPSHTRQKKPCRLSSNWSRMIYIHSNNPIVTGM
jgi:hypothetical protein